MNWQRYGVANDSTHHVLDGRAVYDARFLAVLGFHEPGLAAVVDTTGAFHIRPDGTAAYVARFRRTFGFYAERAAVEVQDGAFHIDLHGAAIGDRCFSWCGNFQGGASVVRDFDGAYFHVRRDGADLYRARWRYVGDFREGLAVALDDEGLHRHIDALGRQHGERRFRNLDVFHKGFARAADQRGWFHLRRDGSDAYAARFADVEPFYNGQARCLESDGGLIVINEAGEIVARLRSAAR